MVLMLKHLHLVLIFLFFDNFLAILHFGKGEVRFKSPPPWVIGRVWPWFGNTFLLFDPFLALKLLNILAYCQA